MYGRRVAQMRELRGWNQSELGRRSGIAIGMINQIESGRKNNPTLATLIKLAAAFDMPVDKFVKLLAVEAEPARAA